MSVTNVTAGAETFTSNAFLVTGEVTALVDVGAMVGVESVIQEHVADLERVYITHQHGDHIAELPAVVDAFDPEVYAAAGHELRTGSLDGGDTVPIGDTSYTVVPTPGHADDHVSFVGPRTLFSGDVVVHDDGAFSDGSFGRTDAPDQSRTELIESIERLLEAMPPGVERMYSGHGSEFQGDVRAVVERALERAARHEPKYPEE